MFISKIQYGMKQAEKRNIEKYGRTWGESIFTKMERKKQEKKEEYVKIRRALKKEYMSKYGEPKTQYEDMAYMKWLNDKLKELGY